MSPPIGSPDASPPLALATLPGQVEKIPGCMEPPGPSGERGGGASLRLPV